MSALGSITLASLLLLALAGCEDKATALARCENEASRVLGGPVPDVIYVKNCMRIAGYKADPQCAGFSQLYCYTPTGLMAKVGEALSGGE